MSSEHSGSEADNPFQRLEPLFAPSLTSLDDRMEKFNGELYRDMKRKLYSGRKDDPATRVEVRSIGMYLMKGLRWQGSKKKNEERLFIELLPTRR